MTASRLTVECDECSKVIRSEGEMYRHSTRKHHYVFTARF